MIIQKQRAHSQPKSQHRLMESRLMGCSKWRWLGVVGRVTNYPSSYSHVEFQKANTLQGPDGQQAARDKDDNAAVVVSELLHASSTQAEQEEGTVR